jgi:hypothetical protein
MKIGSAVIDMFHVYRQTDWTKLMGAFSQYRLRTRQKILFEIFFILPPLGLCRPGRPHHSPSPRYATVFTYILLVYIHCRVPNIFIHFHSCINQPTLVPRGLCYLSGCLYTPRCIYSFIHPSGYFFIHSIICPSVNPAIIHST